MTIAGEGQVPVGQLLSDKQRKPSRLRKITRWRDWHLPVKLAAVIVVPIVIAIVLGATTISGQVARSERYERLDERVAATSAIGGLVGELQNERAVTSSLLTDGTAANSAELDGIRNKVDGLTGPMKSAIDKADLTDPGVVNAIGAANAQVAGLPGIRDQIAAGQIGPPEAVNRYSEINSALLNLNGVLVAGTHDEAIGELPAASHDVELATEASSVAQSIVSIGIARGNLAPSELSVLEGAQIRLTDRLAEFRAVAAQPAEANAVTGANFDSRDAVVRGILAANGDPAGDPSDALRAVPSQEWLDSSGSVIGQLDQLGSRLDIQLKDVSTGLREKASSEAGLLAVILFAALVLTIVVVFVIARQLLRSLRVLRVGAQDVADAQLPTAVRNIQEGRTQSTEVRPIAVTTNDEIGHVGRAFDAVHSQALRLAVEQAKVRTGYGSVFVNLSRRSQSLVQRQLQMIERLERDEEDADQLATLFQLDHLATRMRRNNENLMVLSGSDPGKRSGQPVGVTDVLRAAVSEIEHYQRVMVQSPPSIRVLGHAASDLMRLLAELLDNATAFSAPETQVTVASRVIDGGALSIDVLDSGIGMTESEVAEANSRLSEVNSVDLATSRRMGLFVIGRLASRHGIAVSIHGGKDIAGIRATTTVPASLVVGAEAMEAPQPRTPESPDTATRSGAPLPRRNPSRNGAVGPTAFAAGPTSGRSDNGGCQQIPAQQTEMEISGPALFDPRCAGSTPGRPVSRGEGETETVRSSAKADPNTPEPTTARTAGSLGGATLFDSTESALTEWWTTATTGAEPAERAQASQPVRPENTPIFDETVSAWFRTDLAEQSDRGPAEATSARPDRDWEFEADERWRTVQAVSESAPSAYTAAGLPLRRRGEQLLPGSATAGGSAVGESREADSAQPYRDPTDVRGRLSSFQRGVNKARTLGRGAEHPAGSGTEPPRQATGYGGGVGTEHATQHREGDGNSDGAEQTNQGGPAAAAAQGSSPEWTFPTDENWRAARTAAESVPSSYTSAGLPRRRRGERLVPGSADAAEPASSTRSTRDAHELRGRLSSFQQGVRRGRHRTGQSTERNDEKVEGE